MSAASPDSKRRSKRTLDELERGDTFNVAQQRTRRSSSATASDPGSALASLKSPKKRSSAVQAEEQVKEEKDLETSSPAHSPPKKQRSPRKKAAAKEESSPQTAATDMKRAPVPPAPVSPPSVSRKFVGAHLSVAGGMHQALTEAVRIKANAVALFTKNQRTWKGAPITAEAAADFRKTMAELKFDPEMILPHGSYLINLCSPDEGLEKSRAGFLDELKRCETLGIKRYNLHPGSTRGELSLDEGLRLVAESVNWAHERTSGVTVVLENTAGGGYTIGRNFEELGKIIEMVKDKSRVGVCLDTCHMFAAGYDVRTPAAFAKTMEEFDKKVGFKYLKGMHLNDSKSELGSNKDRHENIGKGCIGLECFRTLMTDSRFDMVPLILETPASSDDSYAKEIALLRSFEKLAS